MTTEREAEIRALLAVVEYADEWVLGDAYPYSATSDEDCVVDILTEPYGAQVAEALLPDVAALLVVAPRIIRELLHALGESRTLLRRTVDAYETGSVSPALGVRINEEMTR